MDYALTLDKHERLKQTLLTLAQQKSTEPADEWVERSVVFNEPDCRGQFSFYGREFAREIIQNWQTDEVTDMVQVWGSRTSKTRTCYAGIAWTLKHKSVRILYVKPKAKGTAGAEDDATNRFIPMMRASPEMAELMPKDRHSVKRAQQVFGPSIIDWTGSNSVSALASNPCAVVVQDEVDKFNSSRKRSQDGEILEGDASSLADERTKDATLVKPKRVKCSTPTIASGIIWVEFKKSDQRRRFVPCLACGEKFVMAWSSAFTVFPKKDDWGNDVPTGYVEWDKEAKAENGAWDYKRVESTAGIVCPHCNHKHRTNHEKIKMDRDGEWKATANGAPGYVGYHLSSLYSCLPECSFGKLAVKFLKACRSLDGPRSFINSDLAEPYAAQEVAAKRIEKATETIEPGNEWRTLLSVDCQQKAPYFWYIARSYSPERKSVGLEGGPLDSWDAIEEVQKRLKIPDAGVVIDSGFGAKSDAEVYRHCAEHGEIFKDDKQRKAVDGVIAAQWSHVGWMPSKGQGGRQRWKDVQTNMFMPWRYRPTDPYMGTADAGRVQLDLFEFAADFFKDILAVLRANKKDIGYIWTINPKLDTDEYHEHMRGQHKVERVKAAQVVCEWERRHRHAKDHLYACEVLQVAYACAIGLIDIASEKIPKK